MLSQEHPHTQSVKKVSQKLLLNSGVFHELRDYPWEFLVAVSDQPNVVCVPGKVVVFTGILPYVKDESGLATVLAHELVDFFLSLLFWNSS